LKKRYHRILIILIILPSLLLQGCWIPHRPTAPVAVLPEPPDPMQLLDATQADLADAQAQTPGQFTLRYDPDSTMNPIFALNRDNIVISSLLYESLFVLTEDLVAEPLLCANWHTYDNITFTFEIYPNIMMHDGYPMTASDVSYSLRQAMNHSQSRHRNKLRNISEITSDGELTVTIRLSSPNARFIRLLDIPIIRSGTSESSRPPGSGPFIFTRVEEIVGIYVPEVIDYENNGYEYDDVLISEYLYDDEYEEEIYDNDSFDDIPYDVPYDDSYSYYEQPQQTYIMAMVSRLIRFTDYRYFAHLPLTQIELIQGDDSELTELFDNFEISLLWDDPLGAFDIRIGRLHEPRLFHTTALKYLGFNANSRVLENADVRRAIGLAIDRQHIVDNIMSTPRPGQAIAAPVAIHPIFDMYDDSWEIGGDPLGEMGALLDRAGLYDYDYELFLQMPDGAGGFFPFTLSLIVNIENTHRVETAHWIAETLSHFGIRVRVNELSWSDFIFALQTGDFHMYIGETMLGADFDLSPLLLPGASNLNFGNTASSVYRPLIENFLAAETQEEVSEAGRVLNLAITQDAPFIPILYKRHAIYTHMGTVLAATPSQSGVFHNFQNWEINTLMLD